MYGHVRLFARVLGRSAIGGARRSVQLAPAVTRGTPHRYATAEGLSTSLDRRPRYVSLDQITTERVARFAATFAKYSRKTLANVLHTLSKLLRTAVDWDVLPQMPCKIKIP